MRNFVLLMKYRNGTTRVLDQRFNKLEAERMAETLNKKTEVASQGLIQVAALCPIVARA